MKTLTAMTLFWSTYPTTAHYLFSRISLNGGPISDAFTYVRSVTPGWIYSPGAESSPQAPQYDVYDANIRCGRGAATRPSPQTLTVNAGDELAFFPGWYDNETNRPVDIYHPGPGGAYLSKAPNEDIDHYEGDGDWFKIGTLVNRHDEVTWLTLGALSMNFTIPKTTPPGKYLMRVEHMYLQGWRFNASQFYINCAQLEIKGPGGGNPGPMVRFPGAYSPWDSTIWVPSRIIAVPVNLTGYAGPGPAVWTG